jgi:hypothetical protein
VRGKADESASLPTRGLAQAGSTLQARSEPSELHVATTSQTTKPDTSFVKAETSVRLRCGKSPAACETHTWERSQAAPASSFFEPLPTMTKASSGSGRCNARASGAGASIQTSISACERRITGMALG